MAEMGRPKQNTDEMVSMTLRLTPAYYEKLSQYARRCGIASVNSYSTFMLYQHCNRIDAAERELGPDGVPSISELVSPGEP